MYDHTLEYGGHTFKAFIEPDYYHPGAPWDVEDCHGPVSGWEVRNRYREGSGKRPGEWELCRDGNSVRYYDAQEAMKIAKRDGWWLSEEDIAKLALKLNRTPTSGQIRAEAVRRDFEYLRGWCGGLWEYVGVVVAHVPQGVDEDDVTAADALCSVWGIPSNDGELICVVAHDLAREITRGLEDEQKSVAGQPSGFQQGSPALDR